MNVDERKRLLAELSILAAHPESENVSGVSPAEVFLPLPAHRLALRPETVVVRGGRGAGKSALFGLLNRLHDTAQMRAFFSDPRLPEATWLEAFAQSAKHPPETVLDSFGRARGNDDLRAFWMAHLLLRLLEEKPGLCEPPPELHAAWLSQRANPQAWVPLASRDLGTVAAKLDEIETRLAERGEMAFATYDHLDRIGAFDRGIRQRYVSSLLALWLSLSNRFRCLRAKIFLREDLLDAGELGFPDASKLRARSVSLDWDVESIYRVAVRHMGLSEGLRAWLSRVQGGPVLVATDFGWIPGEMPEPIQQAFATHLCGEVMGTGTRKGYTHRWIPNHLQDAQNKIVPRSIIVLLGVAAARAAAAPLTDGPRLMKPQDLVGALDETSRARVSELQEEYRLVGRLNHLADMHVPLERDEVIGLIAKPAQGELPLTPFRVSAGPHGAHSYGGDPHGAHPYGSDPYGTSDQPRGGAATDGRAVLDELVRLGVLAIRPDGRVDVPDIYRAGFGIKRKGGAARPR